ncbi:uncharacterized protein LACBIDRAFT_312481 [Laccaria bicolor S238N-H82]|uniref:Predicted protein n=1 Tax=Laccaria bicolor (strain S238N-H82 / ATCC MYA-4686) TaxID=486041 RepID=B0DW97_LACBS|nr:uncharacterized protein LACBIDRAFT_312481 [Laccaria bicolor S238N-H82]EDR01150.1 predicted protein [Laccaria bicolor S238N-H82]|eukprot:XP_001888192.1 predicted protein [Laccaria bicolor S238N-H82]
MPSSSPCPRPQLSYWDPPFQWPESWTCRVRTNHPPLSEVRGRLSTTSLIRQKSNTEPCADGGVLIHDQSLASCISQSSTCISPKPHLILVT